MMARLYALIFSAALSAAALQPSTTMVPLRRDVFGHVRWQDNTIAIGFLMPIASRPARLTYSGAASGSVTVVKGFALNLTTPGTYTITVNARCVVTFKGISAGGAGGGTDPIGTGVLDGAGGGGSGSYTTGTSIALFPLKTYTLSVPDVATWPNAGAALTFTNTTDALTLVSLGGGQNGGSLTSGVGGVASTGSNLHNGQNGGARGQQGVPGSGSAGGTDANGAGGGGSGGSQDGGAGPWPGGTGKSSGPHGSTSGGGWLFGAVECGAGGNGASNDGVNVLPGNSSQQGGCVFSA